ncbi:MAG: SDR family NAD(P)-dependent oxidoreductase [Pseudooceanicola sp.]
MAELDGKVALVTGAASGIGAACAETLARAGAAVVLTDIDAGGGEDVVNRIAAEGGKAEFHLQDVTDEARWREVLADIDKGHGRLDALVSNAGIGIPCPDITEMSLEDWRRQTAINLDGVFLSLKHGLPLMRRAGNGGSVVLLSSVAGLRGAPTLAGYSATKGAVRLLAKSVALECAAAEDGIRVNSVHPGIIDTPIWEAIAANATVPGSNVRVDGRMLGLASPVGRAGAPQDIADGVLYLCSDASRYMTGSELVIDGGMSAGNNRRAPRPV